MDENKEKADLEQFVCEINEKEAGRFNSIPFNERFLFLSHCIRADLKAEIEEYARGLGYAVHTVGGGSIVYKIIVRDQPRAVVGIACRAELEMAIEKLDIPLNIIPLESDGCKDTTFNMEQAKAVLSRHLPDKESVTGS